MSIRLARPGDAEAIAAIYAPNVRDTAISFEEVPPGPDEMRQRIAKILATYPWLVWDDGGRVAGYAYASAHRERAGYRWSVDVACYVSPDARRRGIGQALYRRLLPILAAQGLHSAFAGIALPNAASVALHESVGFTQVATYREVGFKLGAWHDTGWWQCILAPAPTSPGEPIPLGRLGPGVLDDL